MPAIHVYVTKALLTQMEEARFRTLDHKISWSAIAQRAFKKECERLAKKRGWK